MRRNRRVTGKNLGPQIPLQYRADSQPAWWHNIPLPHPSGESSLDLDEDELDRLLAEAEEESDGLEREEEKAQKICCLAKLEDAIGSGAAACSRMLGFREHSEPSGLPPTAELQQQQQRAVNIADLQQNQHIDHHAGALLRTLSLVSVSDSQPDCVVSDERRRSTKQGRRLRSGMETRATDVVVNPQFWPYVALPLEQVGKLYSFTELDLRLLVAGELSATVRKRVVWGC